MNKGQLFNFCLNLILFVPFVNSVDRGNFKTCEQSGFCRRNRKLVPRESTYVIEKDSYKTEASKFEANIINTQNNIKFRLEFFALANNTARLKINELDPLKPRFEVKESIYGDLRYDSISLLESSDQSRTYTFGDSKVLVNHSPFRLDLISGQDLVATFNSRGLFNFEHMRTKPQPPEEKVADPDADNENPDAQNEDEEPAADVPPEANNPPAQEEETDLWEETYKSHTDSKPNGPTSISLDLSFFNFDNVYGIPEHADDLSLKSTKDTDPYRLYNLDVFEYELSNPMALYGSIPYMIAHREDKTIGVFWNNAAEMWVDIDKKTSPNVVTSVMNFVSGETQIPQVDTHWMAESGIVDVYFFMGPKPSDVVFQYSRITGTSPIPPLFSIGYHQCRWNYVDQTDVLNVNAGFEEHDIPYDVLWLDIEHTEDKKYFTWDQKKFPESAKMIDDVAYWGRKMVTITDPHIKRSGGYHIFDDATSNSLFVKDKSGSDFDGWCWSGSSSYTDYLNPSARKFWSSLYKLENYKGSTINLYTWIDMNEPSVFNGPEITMHKDCKHFGDVEHREIHNIYGLLMHNSTYEGHVMRSEGKLRPFILSRSFFAGSQRYGAIWTGDNMAEWGHLKISLPMLLSINVAGLPFCGADIGGFFHDPDSQLLVRWYQAGAFQPFMRAHAHIETKRREPWLFGQEVMERIREAVRIRYSLIPLWYTLYYEHEQNGMPVMRPMWMEFPTDKNTFTMQDQYMLGDTLLVHPVVESDATSVTVYFPENSLWYDFKTKQQYQGPSSQTLNVDMDSIPVFQKAGTILPKKERIRRSLSLTINDPYTLIVALDKENKAEGKLYIDDGSSFNYRDGHFLQMKFTFQNNKLSCSQLNNIGSFVTKTWLERVIIVGMKTNPSSIHLKSANIKDHLLASSYQQDTEELTIRKPGINMAEEWEISIN